MNRSQLNRSQLPKIEEQFELWLQLMVDNELDAGSRREFLQFVEARPEQWRSVALKFIETQFMGSVLSAAIPASSDCQQGWVSQPEAKAVKPKLESETTGAKRTRWLLRAGQVAGLATAACLLVLFGWRLHDRLVAGELIEQHQESLARLSRQVDLIQEADLPSGQDGSVREASYLESSPLMIEVANTPRRLAYYTERPLPKFFLEALIFAGHDVVIKQETTDVQLEDGTFEQFPVFYFEVQKDALWERYAVADSR